MENKFKVGGLISYSRYGTIETITEVNKSFFLTDKGTKFSSKSGRRWGHKIGSPYSETAYSITLEELEERKRDQERSRLIKLRNAVQGFWGQNQDVSNYGINEVVDKLNAAIEELEPKKSAVGS